MATTTGNADKSPSALLRSNIQHLKEKRDKLQNDAKAAVRRMPEVLTEQELRRLREHKYASEGTTLFDPVMQEFWKWLVEYCPLWVAPNLVTIVGLAMNIGTSVLLMIETNGAKEQVCPFGVARRERTCFRLVLSVDLFLHGAGAFHLSITRCHRRQTSAPHELTISAW